MCDRFCDQEILQFLKACFFLNITPKVPHISPITKFHRHIWSQFVPSVMPSLRKVIG